MSEAIEITPQDPPAPRTVDLFGETFELADKIGLMPLMRFAHLAKGGADSNDMDALDAMYTLIRQCFTPASWARFEVRADEVRADQDDLLGAVAECMKAMTARPTGRPSGSSGGSPHTSTSSAVASSSPAAVLVERGRPDLASIVVQAEEFLAAESRASA